jgi:hypothetical protein
MGNVIVGGVVGVGVDAVSGAALEHVPNPVTVVLRPIGPEPRAPATPRRRRDPPPPRESGESS